MVLVWVNHQLRFHAQSAERLVELVRILHGNIPVLLATEN